MAQLKVIKTEHEYYAGLEYLNALLDEDPKPGSNAADDLEVLSVLLEKYEDENFPMDMPDPIDAIRFRMDQEGLMNRDLVKCIGSMSRVSEVLNHKRPLSLSMIRALHKELGIPANVLLQENTAPLPAESDLDWKKFPINEMYKKEYFNDFSGTIKDLKTYAEDLLSEFLLKADEPALTAVKFKHTINAAAHKRSTRVMNQYALLAWCARVISHAKDKNLSKKYKKGTVNKSFMRKVAKLSWSTQGPSLAREFLQQHGIYLIFEQHLQKTYLDGASFILSNGHPVVAMTLRYDRIDNFWFVLMHELAHIALHLDGDKGIFLDDLDSQSEAIEEKQADDMAEEALLPNKTLLSSKAWQYKTPDYVLKLADRLEIHPSIIVGRMQNLTKNYRLLNRAIGRGQGEVRCQFEA